jgi:hypothetical protein
MLAIPKSPSYLLRSVRIVNKICAEEHFRSWIKNRFCGLKVLGEVLPIVRFDDSSARALDLPADVLAESWRDAPLTDFTIFVNWRFKAQFKNHQIAIQNKRLHFVLAVTIIHEICHLCLRKQGIMNTPSKFPGLYVPEAGEFFEKHMFEGLVTIRLSDGKKTKNGWDPVNMHVTAVLIKNGFKDKVVCDSEIERLCECVDSKLPFPQNMFPMKTRGLKGVSQHALKRANGVHEGVRSKRVSVDFDEPDTHPLDRGFHRRCKKFRH